MDYLGLISLFALGPAMIMKPEYLWEVEHIFTVDGAGPVSYTHLDVYKRQMHILWKIVKSCDSRIAKISI